MDAARHPVPRSPAEGAHICFVIAALGAGGAERVISLLAGRWTAMGWRVTVISFDGPSDPVYHRFEPTVRLIRLGLGAGAGGTARRVLALRRALRAERPDVVLSFLTKINAISLLATIGSRIPVAVAERNNPDRQRAHPLWNAMLRLLYRRADRIICQTHGSIACFPQRVRRKIRVIPNPIAAPGARAARAGAGPPHRMVAVGRLTEQKGFDRLIPAFARAARDYPDWRLDIWGEGSDRPTLEAAIAAADAGDRIALCGLSQEPGGWVAGAKAFVLSSRYEGFPNVLGEAMAAGLPVIAVDCPFGPADLVADGVTGLLVPDGDEAALTEAIERIFAAPMAARAMGRLARRAVAPLHPTQVARQWEEVILSLLLRPGEPSQRRHPLKGGRRAPGTH